MRTIITIIFIIMCIGTCKAQTFNFGCEPSFEGTITITGAPFVLEAIDPNNITLGNGAKFELTIPGLYTIKLYALETIIKTLTVTQTGNQTLLWSEI